MTLSKLNKGWGPAWPTNASFEQEVSAVKCAMRHGVVIVASPSGGFVVYSHGESFSCLGYEMPTIVRRYAKAKRTGQAPQFN